MASKESTATLMIGCIGTTAGLAFAFPLWVFVMRTILLRGEATDFEWGCFYAYCGVNVFIQLLMVGAKALMEAKD